MNCPLIKAAAIMSPTRTNAFDVSCDEGDCALWDEAKGRCSVRMIAHLLEAIAINLANLVNNMPHELQLRK